MTTMPAAKSNVANATPNLSTVIAAVRPQIFSFFPLGSLINGHRSPLLVSTIFHDSVFLCLGQSETLNLSSCPHLRKLSDKSLIRLIRNIVEICGAHHPEYPRYVERRRVHNCSGIKGCPCPIKAVHLDLSRCPFLKREGVYFALKHMPGVKRILLSSCIRFDASDNFEDEDCFMAIFNPSNLDLPKLEYLDVAGCTKLNSRGIQDLFKRIRGHDIRHLDISGCSTLVDDSIAAPVAALCHNLECLSLAGSKVTAYGAGIIAYCCRSTLRSLSLRGCEEIHLPKLLFGTCREIIERIASDSRNDRVALPPNFVGNFSDVEAEYYYSQLLGALHQMLRAYNDYDDVIDLSERYMIKFKDNEKRWAKSCGWANIDNQVRLFGKLEKLDIGLLGNRGIKLQGCLATISWLNGGRLKHVDLCGLESVSDADIYALMSTSGPRLQSLQVASSVSNSSENFNANIFDKARNLSELDVSFSCGLVDCHRISSVFERLANLRSLKLDHLQINNSHIYELLWRLKRLMRLSIRGCSALSTKDVWVAGKINKKLKLIELDVRDVPIDTPLTELRSTFPDLLKLNNRCTARGTKMLEEHRSNVSWRVGAREHNKGKAKKRKRGVVATCGTSESGDTQEAEQSTINRSSGLHRCSILRTGFSKCKETEQEMFCCKTCCIEFGTFVCLECSKFCHDGHEIHSIGYGPGYCDCCVLSDCKCLGRDEE